MIQTISLRSISDGDLPLLYRIYASTREDELKIVPWSDAEKERFLRQQFEAQHSFYQEHFSEGSYDLILAGEDPAGRLYVDRRADEIRLIDLAILPEYRRQGIGRSFLDNLLLEAREASVPVRLHCLPDNDSMVSLCKQLGFEQTGATGVYVLMEWNADGQED